MEHILIQSNVGIHRELGVFCPIVSEALFLHEVIKNSVLVANLDGLEHLGRDPTDDAHHELVRVDDWPRQVLEDDCG